MVRAPCCEKLGLKKGPWTPEEDHKLITYIHSHGHRSWRGLPKQAGLSRCGKSCRLRWTNYLRPGIKRGNFSSEEEHIIIQLHATFGNRWSAIATHLPGRTDNEIKNYWNTRLKKRLLKMGIDPFTDLPAASSTSPMMADCSYPNPLLKSALLRNNLTSPNQYYSTASTAGVPAALAAQWDVARLEAEARLAVNDYASSSDCNINQLLIHLLTMQMLGVYQGAANSVENTKHQYAEQQQGFNSANMYMPPCSKLNPFTTINTDSMLNLNEVAYDYNSNMPSYSSEQQLLPFLENILEPSSEAAMSANFSHTELPRNASLANEQAVLCVQGQCGNESANHLLADGAPQLAGSFFSDINTRKLPHHHAVPMTLPPTLLWDELVMTQQADNNDVASSTPSTVSTSSADNNKDYWANLLKLVTSNYHLHQR